LMVGDADIVMPEHVVELFRLLGGGALGEPTAPAQVQLAILPGTGHVQMLDRTEWVASMITAFLA
jgi:pimeloyl-ACP methyl ester carboxylesterase